jgi:hypothetical protein
VLDIIAVLPPINGIDITQDQVEFFEAAIRLVGLLDKIPDNLTDLQIVFGGFEIGGSPRTPKATVQSVLSQCDLVLIDTGSYGAGTITLGSADSGAMFAGTPEGSAFAAGSRWRLVGADDVVIDGLSFAGGNGPAIEIDYVRTTPADESNGNVLRRLDFGDVATAIRLERGAGNVVELSRIDGAATVGIDAISTTALSNRGSEIFDASTAVRLDHVEDGVVDGNTIVGSASAAVHAIDATGTVIATNVIEDVATGVWVVGGDAITIDDNGILAAATGVLAQNSTNFLASGNVLDGALTGVRLSSSAATVYDNDIHDNATGLYVTGGRIDLGAYQPVEKRPVYAAAVGWAAAGIFLW